jgi:V8-like Glu-specific endopeptidase
MNSATASLVKIGDKTFVLTNHHVIGPKDCAIEGCFYEATFNYELGKAPIKSELKLTPVATSADLDFTLLSFEFTKNPVPNPKYLDLSKAGGLKAGESYFLVGHPRRTTKKFSKGTFVRYSSGLAAMTYFSLPGNSGSIIFDKDGRVVGLHHKSSTKKDLVTKDEDLNLSYISTTQGLLASIKELTLKSLHQQGFKSLVDSDSQPLTAASLDLYKNARRSPPTKNALDAGKKFFAVCLSTKFEDIESSDELDRKAKPCLTAFNYLTSFSVDWFEKDASKKKALADKLFQAATKMVNFPGNEPWSLLKFSHRVSVNKAESAQRITTFLAQNYDPFGSQNFFYTKVYVSYAVDLDPKVAAKQVERIAAAIKEYKKTYSYIYDYDQIIDALGILNKNNALSKDDYKSLLTSIRTDPSITLVGVLMSDDALYRLVNEDVESEENASASNQS